MLATNRTDSVIGRIILLTISIITIKFISGVGVPMGVRCTSVFFIELLVAFTMTDIHSVSANGRDVAI